MNSDTDNTILNTYNVTKRFGRYFAVDDLNLSVDRGDIFGFLGPNGAGKSTTIRMMLDLVRPTHGTIKIFGQLLRVHRRQILNRVGALIEKPRFYEYLSARKNLTILAKLANIDPAMEVDRTLDIVGLLDRADQKVKAFSDGMKQRLGIAQALLGEPKFIILDEPTTGLDPKGMIDIRNLISELSTQNLTIFLSSHLLHEVEQICNKMAIINNGKLIRQGEVDNLIANCLHLKVDNIEKTAEILKNIDWIQRFENEKSEFRVYMSKNRSADLNRILVESGVGVFSLHQQLLLEDYFLSVIETSELVHDDIFIK